MVQHIGRQSAWYRAWRMVYASIEHGVCVGHGVGHGVTSWAWQRYRMGIGHGAWRYRMVYGVGYIPLVYLT